MSKHLIAESSYGYAIYVDLIQSDAGQHISRQPQLVGLIKEAIGASRLDGESVEIEHDMGRVIGNTDIVKITDTDRTYYAMPHKTTTYMRFAANRRPQPSRKISIILQRTTAGDYNVTHVWIGPYSPPFPSGDSASESSKMFWDSHALAQDSHNIQTKTITTVCPYV